MGSTYSRMGCPDFFVNDSDYRSFKDPAADEEEDELVVLQWKECTNFGKIVTGICILMVVYFVATLMGGGGENHPVHHAARAVNNTVNLVVNLWGDEVSR